MTTSDAPARAGDPRDRSDRGGLRGLEVAFTGRLASMTQQRATGLVEAAGGRVVAMPGPGTDLLVVGQGGPPLGDDGRLTEALRRARELSGAERKAAIRVVSEEELLELLGVADHAELRRLYTTSQLARMLGVPTSRIRAWVRHGLVAPARTVGRLHWFDFRQVGDARVLLRLAQGGVSLARIRRSLDDLGAWLGDAHPALAQLEAIERGGVPVVRLPDGRLAEPGGQLRLGFDGPPPAPILPGPADRAGEPADDDPGAWFEAGVLAESEGRLGDALACYEHARDIATPDAEILFNLGNVRCALGRRAEALECFVEAVRLEPDYVEAWNNLGNVQAGLGRPGDATRSYRRALVLAPDYADAHFNLAETLAELGDVAAAQPHWRAYLEHDATSAWAQRAREGLGEARARDGGGDVGDDAAADRGATAGTDERGGG